MATTRKPRKTKTEVEAVPTIGADPEFFIKRTDTGAPFPICGLLGGTKGKPIELAAIYGGQEDNVMAEYNIPPVTAANPMFTEHVFGGRNAVMAELNRKFPGEYEADTASSRLFPHTALATEQAQMFGCSQDFDAYNVGLPHSPIDRSRMRTTSGEWRFCGGHVHFGYKHFLDGKFPEYVVALFADVFLGLPMVRYDKQGMRRGFYGTAGRYRPTKWGIEYRTLSNLWTFDQGLADMVSNNSYRLGEFLKRPPADIRKAWAEIPWDSVRTAICTEDRLLGESVLAHSRNYGLEV